MNIRVPINEQGEVAGHAAQRRQSAGDSIPPNCQVIEVHVAELNQLFNAIDPAPFRERDLDPDAEEFIVGWAREVPADASLRSSSISIVRLGFLRSRRFCETRTMTSSASVLRPRGDVSASCSGAGAPVS